MNSLRRLHQNIRTFGAGDDKIDFIMSQVMKKHRAPLRKHKTTWDYFSMHSQHIVNDHTTENSYVYDPIK